MSVNIAQLKTELTTDPSSLGYAASVATRDDSITAGIINLIRAGISIKRSDISPSEVFHAIDVSDLLTTLTTTNNSYLECLLTAPYNIRLLNDDGTDTPVRTNMIAMLKAGSTPTKTRLAAIGSRSGSRAEQLFGAGTVVSVSDVTLALTT